MLTIFKPKPLISHQSACWILQTFAWALQNFDDKEFFERSKLIQPTNEFFSGRVDSIHSTAQTIFQHCLKYSGLSHWPFLLQKPEEFINTPPPFLGIQSFTRDSATREQKPLDIETPISLSYHPHQTSKAEDLAASFAHLFAQHLVMQSQKLPPGGKDYYAEATEVVAIFFGFGVMFANSAHTYRGGCGSCYNPNANRKATLSENEVVFSLAVFCHLKKIDTKTATKHLKSHLKGHYKQAVKQIAALSATNDPIYLELESPSNKSIQKSNL